LPLSLYTPAAFDVIIGHIARCPIYVDVRQRPGDQVLYDSTAPYTLVDLDGYRQHQVRMPIENLALPRDLLRRVSAVRLRGHLERGGVVSYRLL
jgi:hypothetical protein